MFTETLSRPKVGCMSGSKKRTWPFFYMQKGLPFKG
jgi:hypothetical protein